MGIVGISKWRREVQRRHAHLLFEPRELFLFDRHPELLEEVLPGGIYIGLCIN